MTLTLDEWVEKNAKHLKENLEANLNALTDLSKEEKKHLLRMNLIMLRDWAMDWGIK